MALKKCLPPHDPASIPRLAGHPLLRSKNTVKQIQFWCMDTGCVKEIGAGYTFFWSGKTQSEPRVSGVGFVIRNNIASSLTSLHKEISDRIMTLHLTIANKTHLTHISVYAPTMTHPDEKREAFYSSLQEVIHSLLKKDKLLLLGDFNARSWQQQACLAWSAGLTWIWKGEPKWTIAAHLLHRGKPCDHQHCFQPQGCAQGHLDAAKINTLAPGTAILARS